MPEKAILYRYLCRETRDANTIFFNKSEIVYYVPACQSMVLTSVKVTERAEGELNTHTCQNNKLQAVT